MLLVPRRLSFTSPLSHLPLAVFLGRGPRACSHTPAKNLTPFESSFRRAESSAKALIEMYSTEPRGRIHLSPSQSSSCASKEQPLTQVDSARSNVNSSVDRESNSVVWCTISLLSQDLKDLDEDTLRFRVAQLATEIQERTKWEALRLMEGVQKKEAEIAQKVDTRTLSLRPLLWRVLAWSVFSFSVALPVVPAEKSVKLRLACVAKLAPVAPPTTSFLPPMPPASVCCSPGTWLQRL